MNPGDKVIRKIQLICNQTVHAHANKPTLIVIAGPTAIGKTALGINIARHFDTEILSADSRQFYKEMRIGTAVPSDEELAAVKHHFIQSHSVTDELSVGRFEREALLKLQEIFKEKKVVVMVGGSGLYVNAVLYGFDEMPEVPKHIRDDLNEAYQLRGLSYLQEALKTADPSYYGEVDINNPQRLIRALEVFRSSGKPYSFFRQSQIRERPFQSFIIGIDMEREALYERINQRVDIMMSHGLLEEVKSLTDFQNHNPLKTVGYSELFRYLNGEGSLEFAVDKIKQNTRNFAKRQLTWFRKNKDIHWVHPEDDFRDILSGIKP